MKTDPGKYPEEPVKLEGLEERIAAAMADGRTKEDITEELTHRGLEPDQVREFIAAAEKIEIPVEKSGGISPWLIFFIVVLVLKFFYLSSKYQ